MIVEGFAAIILVPFLHYVQADLVDDRLVGCAIAAELLHIQYLGNDAPYRHPVLVGAVRRRKVQFKHRGSPI